MSEAREIRKLGKIEDIDIYYDQYIEKNNFFFGWRSTPVQEAGMILIPYENMKDCKSVPLPDINDLKENEVLINTRGEVHFMIGSSEDFEDYKKALKSYREHVIQRAFDNNMYNFIQKGI